MRALLAVVITIYILIVDGFLKGPFNLPRTTLLSTKVATCDSGLELKSERQQLAFNNFVNEINRGLTEYFKHHNTKDAQIDNFLSQKRIDNVFDSQSMKTNAATPCITEEVSNEPTKYTTPKVEQVKTVQKQQQPIVDSHSAGQAQELRSPALVLTFDVRNQQSQPKQTPAVKQHVNSVPIEKATVNAHQTSQSAVRHQIKPSNDPKTSALMTLSLEQLQKLHDSINHQLLEVTKAIVTKEHLQAMASSVQQPLPLQKKLNFEELQREITFTLGLLLKFRGVDEINCGLRDDELKVLRDKLHLVSFNLEKHM